MTDFNRFLKKFESDKDLIKQPKISESGVLAPPLSSHIFIGKSGSGKSNLLTNILMNPIFYGGWFDTTVLLSPTAENDSIQQQLKVDKDLVFADLRQGPQVIEKIIASQKKRIREQGSHRAPKIALVLDDIMSGDGSFMRSPQFLSLFTLGRHFNLGVFCCIQACRSKNNGFPKAALLNAGQLFAFAAGQNEIKVLSDNFCPPMVDSKRFERWIYDATREKYSFIHINNKSQTYDDRYRSKLGVTLNLDSLRNKERSDEKSTPTLSTYGPRPTATPSVQKEAGGTAVGGLGKAR